MIGIWDDSAETFLYVTAGVSLFFGLPIFLATFRWATAFGWRIPEDRDLALYFGRCLGAFALVLAALILRAAITGDNVVVTYQVILAASAMMVLVHVWGALERVQPKSETYEIGAWAMLFLLAGLFYPG
jgi:hypothetical protein